MSAHSRRQVALTDRILSSLSEEWCSGTVLIEELAGYANATTGARRVQREKARTDRNRHGGLTLAEQVHEGQRQIVRDALRVLVLAGKVDVRGPMRHREFRLGAGVGVRAMSEEELGIQESRIEAEEARLEAKKQKSFEVIGQALITIYEGKGFRLRGYRNITTYCKARWGYEKTYTYDLMKAARLAQEFSATAEKPIATPPENEYQARKILDEQRARPETAQGQEQEPGAADSAVEQDASGQSSVGIPEPPPRAVDFVIPIDVLLDMTDADLARTADAITEIRGELGHGLRVRDRFCIEDLIPVLTRPALV